MSLKEVQRSFKDAWQLEQKVTEAKPVVKQEIFVPLSLARSSMQDVCRPLVSRGHHLS